MDLDQVEYRIFAHYSNAIGLIEAIKEGKDIHRATASIIYNVPYEDVTPEQREKAKTVNFSLIYGQGDQATADSLNVSVAEARRFKNQYFNAIPEAKPFIDKVQYVASNRGYIRNHYNRRRRLKRNDAYKAVNALIQSCAADYIKSKMLLIQKYFLYYGYKSRMVLVVHDEIVFEIHDSEHHILPELRWLLSDFDTFKVPITAGAELGNPSWGEKVPKDDEIAFKEIPVETLEKIKSFNIYNGEILDPAKYIA